MKLQKRSVIILQNLMKRNIHGYQQATAFMLIDAADTVTITVYNLFREKIRSHSVPRGLFLKADLDAITQKNCISVSYVMPDKPVKERILEDKIRIFNEKFEEAKDARDSIMEYLTSAYELPADELYEKTVNEDEWCFGVNFDKIMDLVHSK